MRMWKKKLIKALWTLLWVLLTMALLTTEAR